MVINVVLGLCLSPLTAIRTVRVDGAPSWDQPRIARILTRLEGVPCALVPRASLESQVLSLPEMRSAHLDRNPLGRAVLHVGYRQAVARLADRRDVGISIEGVIYPSRHLPPDLPTVSLDPGLLRPELGIAVTWPVVAVARLAVRSREISGGKPVSIELGKGSSLCLNMEAGQVNFGSCDDMDAKLAAVIKRLNEDPAYWSKYKVLNVAVASSPSAIPRGVGVQK